MNVLCTAETDPEMDRHEDWFTNDEMKNPVFHDYMKIYVPYCSSDLYAGNRESSEETGNFFFYGEEIVNAVRESLVANFNLEAMESIVVSGSSAGGIGTWKNCNNFAGGNVKCVIDSGGWMPWPVFPEHCKLAAKASIEDTAIFHGSKDDQICVDEHGNDENGILHCGILSTAYVYINHPTFIMENQEDTTFEGRILEVCPVDSNNKTEFLETLKAAAIAELKDSPLVRPDIGFYYPDCRGHMLYTRADILLISDGTKNYTLNDALKEWLETDGDVHLIGKPGEKCSDHLRDEPHFRLIF